MGKSSCCFKVDVTSQTEVKLAALLVKSSVPAVLMKERMRDLRALRRLRHGLCVCETDKQSWSHIYVPLKEPRVSKTATLLFLFLYLERSVSYCRCNDSTLGAL